MQPQGWSEFHLHHQSQTNNDETQEHYDKSSRPITGIKGGIIQTTMGAFIPKYKKTAIEFSHTTFGAFAQQSRPNGRDCIIFSNVIHWLFLVNA